MAHLVICDPSAFFLAEHPALLFNSGNDPLNRDREIVKGNVTGIAPRRGDSRLIDQIGKIGAGKASGEACDFVQIDILADTDFADMHFKDGDTTAFVGAVDEHLPVEPPCP